MGARPGFVGRASELADLRALLDSARSGRGGLAMVVGEPGIGKTALVERAVADADFPVLWARGRDGAPPLWLWDQVVRAARSAGLTELTPTVPAAGDDLGASGHQRFRRFDTLATSLLDLAERTPYAVVLDDVHWADHDSLALLEFLSPSLAGAALVAIATSRTGELDPLPRADATIELSGLGAADLAALIELHTGTTPSEQTVSEVVERTGGNPFFVAEVARLLRATGRGDQPSSWSSALPQGVRGVLVRRFARLPPVDPRGAVDGIGTGWRRGPHRAGCDHGRRPRRRARAPGAGGASRAAGRPRRRPVALPARPRPRRR